MAEDLVETYSFALGERDYPCGTFHYDVAARRLTWSDGVYRMHGYSRGEIVPTLELVISHNHPEDQPLTALLCSRLDSPAAMFSHYHRIIDARRCEHRVLTAGERLLDADGTVSAVHGFMVDMTATVQKETEQISREAVEAANVHRSAIEQAKGILMGAFKIDPNGAFRMLVAASNDSNVKLAQLAQRIADTASTDGTTEALKVLCQHPPGRGTRSGIRFQGGG